MPNYGSNSISNALQADKCSNAEHAIIYLHRERDTARDQLLMPSVNAIDTQNGPKRSRSQGIRVGLHGSDDGQ